MSSHGLYIVNTDLGNERAHTLQILQTASEINAHLPLLIVAPRYQSFDAARAKKTHALRRAPAVKLLWNFGLARPSALALVAFNVPAKLYLLTQKLRGRVSFVYVRSTLFLPLMAAAWLMRIPIFYETHRKPLSITEHLRDALAARLCTGIVAVSARVGKYYAPRKKPALVVHDAVSLERFNPTMSKEEARRLLNIPLDALVCVYTGSVSMLKGLDTLFAAARLLPQVRFICAGRMVGDAGEPPPNVELLGSRPQEELPVLMRAADVLLLPHPDSEYSQSPMKLFEYMASGTPIVATKLESVCEVLSERSATLVAPGDPKALARGISGILEDSATAEAKARRALEKAKAYTWRERGRHIAKFIQGVLYGEQSG